VLNFCHKVRIVALASRHSHSSRLRRRASSWPVTSASPSGGAAILFPISSASQAPPPMPARRAAPWDHRSGARATGPAAGHGHMARRGRGTGGHEARTGGRCRGSGRGGRGAGLTIRRSAAAAPRSEVNAEEAVSNRRYHTEIATWAILGTAHLWLFLKRYRNLLVV
jgi:hypothetical protein